MTDLTPQADATTSRISYETGAVRWVSSRPLLVAGAIAVLLGLSFIGELVLTSGAFSLPVFIWLMVFGFLAGSALVLAVDLPLTPLGWQPIPAKPRLATSGYLIGAAALVCAGIAALEVQTNGSSVIATISWVLGIMLVLTVTLEGDTLTRMRTVLADWRAWRWWVLAVTLVLVLAVALRLPSLEMLPGFVHDDEANDGLQARAIIEGQVPSIFTMSMWSQLPMLIHVWYGLFLWLFGDSLHAQRLGSVVLGTLSVWGLYLLGNELFSRRAGLIAATLLAVYHFSIHFSRVGIEIISGDVAVPFTLYFLVRTIRYRSRPAAIAAGLFLAFDLHAYFGSRICFIAIPVFALILFIGHRPLWIQLLSMCGWVALGFIVGSLPIGVYILHNWQAFNAHTAHETILSDAPDIQTHLLGVFGTLDRWYLFRIELWRTLQTLFYTGDSGLQYGIPHPMLDPVSAALLPAAITYALLRSRHPAFVLCLIATAFVLLIGGALTINMPYWPRLIVLLPLLTLLLAALLDGLWQVLERSPILTIPSFCAAVALFIAIANGNYQWYFNEYEPAIRRSFLAASMDVGIYLRAAPAGTMAYGISNGSFYMDNEAVRFLAPSVDKCNVVNGLNLSDCLRAPDHNILFFVFPDRADLLPVLEAEYPGGKLSVLHTYDLGQSIVVYHIMR